MPGLDLIRHIISLREEELKAWRARHPREASDVLEEARAKVEGREPQYGPVRAYG